MHAAQRCPECRLPHRLRGIITDSSFSIIALARPALQGICSEHGQRHLRPHELSAGLGQSSYGWEFAALCVQLGILLALGIPAGFLGIGVAFRQVIRMSGERPE